MSSGPPSPTGNIPPAPVVAGQQTPVGTSNNSQIASLYTIQYINDPSWPADLRLDCSLSNWPEWSRRLKLLCKRQGFGPWLEGSLPAPDPTEQRAYHIWTINDQSLTGFILQYVSEEDYKDVCDLPNSRAIFAELRNRHEKLGPQSQILLLEKAIRTEFTPGVRLTQTWDELDTLIRRIKAIGALDYDRLQIACAIKGLGKHYENLQSILQSITNMPNFTIKDIHRRIAEEDQLIRSREEQGLLPSSAALISQTKTRAKTTCSHCKRVGHFAEFCVQPGGKMAGRSLEEAKAAYRASRGRTDGSTPSQTATTPSQSAPVPSKATTANVATTGTVVTAKGTLPMSGTLSTTIHGVTYNLVPATPNIPLALPPPPVDTTMCAFSSASITEVDYDYDFHANIAMCGEPRTSVDWSKFTRPTDVDHTVADPVAYSASRVPMQSIDESPFFLDTGANAHISPE